MITKAGTETTYRACHAKGHGGGHFCDLEYDTVDEAEKEIYRVTNGIKSHDETQTVEEQYREYWRLIGENMRVVKVTTIIEEMGL